MVWGGARAAQHEGPSWHSRVLHVAQHAAHAACILGGVWPVCYVAGELAAPRCSKVGQPCFKRRERNRTCIEGFVPCHALPVLRLMNLQLLVRH